MYRFRSFAEQVNTLKNKEIIASINKEVEIEMFILKNEKIKNANYINLLSNKLYSIYEMKYIYCMSNNDFKLMKEIMLTQRLIMKKASFDKTNYFDNSFIENLDEKCDKHIKSLLKFMKIDVIKRFRNILNDFNDYLDFANIDYYRK